MPADKKKVDNLFARFIQLIQQVVQEPTADHVHQLRTNTRRVEALLASPERPSSSSGKLSRQLKSIRKRAGKVRDIDVQIVALKSVQLERHYEHKQRVLAALQRRRVKAANKLVALVSKSGEEVKERLEKRKAKIFNSDPKDATVPKVDFYRAALESFQQAAMREDIQEGGEMDPRKLHEFRTVAKTARYTAELAGNGPPVKALLKELERVQDTIGDWHDWLVLQETATEELRGARASALISILENIVGAKFAAAIRTTAEVIEKLQPPAAAVNKKQPTSVRPASRTKQAAAGF